MFSVTTLGLFALASVLLALTPGPDMLYIATRSVAQGRIAGVVSALGVHAGVLVHTLAAALGLSALIAASATVFTMVKYAGAAYLIYLGLQTMMAKERSLEIMPGDHARLREVFCQGLVTNLLNPKVILFFLAFLPQFADPSRGNLTVQLLVLGVLVVLLTLPIDIAVGLVGGCVGRWLRARSRTQRMGKWMTGAVFIALGVGTALSDTRRS